MALRRFREVRRGYVNEVAGDTTSHIYVLLESDAGLGFTNGGRGVLFMEVFIMAISTNVNSGGGCLIRRCAYQSTPTAWSAWPENDHRGTYNYGSGAIYGTYRTTPFPNGAPTANAWGVTLGGSYPLEYIDFATTGSAGTISADISYYLNENSDYNNIHYQITMEGFEDDGSTYGA